MDQKIIRDIRILKWYSFLITILLVLFAFHYFRTNAKSHFTEIDVERINIVEKNGQLKMVISNKEKQHPGLVAGKSLPPRERDAGIIFFNSSSEECGGLVYDGNQ